MRASELAKKMVDMAVTYNDPEVLVYTSKGGEDWDGRRNIQELLLDRKQASPTSPVKFTVVL